MNEPLKRAVVRRFHTAREESQSGVKPRAIQRLAPRFICHDRRQCRVVLRSAAMLKTDSSDVREPYSF